VNRPLHDDGIEAAPNPLQHAFLRWQCRVRQLAMRNNAGRPDAAITPSVTLEGEHEKLGHIITVLSKAPAYSKTSELLHMARKTNDPAEQREQALRYFSAVYYQKSREFCDILTATFPPNSPSAAALRAGGRCTLTFEAYAQRYDLLCKVLPLGRRNPLYEATWWHNKLFNPSLHPETEILGFVPDWSASSADPMP